MSSSRYGERGRATPRAAPTSREAESIGGLSLSPTNSESLRERPTRQSVVPQAERLGALVGQQVKSSVANWLNKGLRAAAAHLAAGEAAALGEEDGVREAEQLDGFATAEPGQAWYLEVEVRWRMDDMESEAVRANMGQVNLKRGRMVYLHI